MRATILGMAVDTPVTTPEQVADDLLRFVMHAKESQREAFRAAADLDLSLAQLQGLYALWVAEQPLALHELSEQMGLSVGAASRAVHALYHDGYVSRTEDASDRRVRRIALTERGDAVLERLAASRRDALVNFLATLTGAERDALARGLAPALGRLGDAG